MQGEKGMDYIISQKWYRPQLGQSGQSRPGLERGGRLDVQGEKGMDNIISQKWYRPQLGQSGRSHPGLERGGRLDGQGEKGMIMFYYQNGIDHNKVSQVDHIQG